MLLAAAGTVTLMSYLCHAMLQGQLHLCHTVATQQTRNNMFGGAVGKSDDNNDNDGEDDADERS
jgi:hypothetical protein